MNETRGQHGVENGAKNQKSNGTQGDIPTFITSLHREMNTPKLSQRMKMSKNNSKLTCPIYSQVWL